MFNGNRKFYIALRVAALVVAIYFVWSLHSFREYQEDHTQKRENISAYQAETSEQYPAICFEEGNSIVALFKCLINTVDANRNAQRTQYDLYAQQEMAEWAYALFLLTFAGFFASALGLMGLFLSLQLNRRATDAAVQSAKFVEESFLRVERPYLHVKVLEDFFLNNVDAGMAHIEYTFNNYGKSPAIVKSYNIRLEFRPDFPLRLPMSREKLWYEVIEPGKGFSSKLRSEVDSAVLGQAFHERAGIIFHGSIHYDDQMGAHHIDRFCLRWSPTGFTLEGGDEYNYRKTEYPKGMAKESSHNLPALAT